MGSFKIFDLKQRHFYLTTLSFTLLFCSLYLIYFFLGGAGDFPSDKNLIKWDAYWYDSIKVYGYAYRWYSASNTAFFPLFPYFWKILNVGAGSISVINFFILLLSLNILYRVFDIQIKYLFIFISLPCTVFFFVPYTESLFFFFCTVFLTGIKKDKIVLTFIGLLLGSLTRATALFFVPAIIFMEIMAAEKLVNRTVIKNVFVISSASILGLLIVVLIEYYQTGIWFAFAKQQNRFWEHKFDWPGFPLVAHGGDNSLWIDGIAFVFGFCIFFIPLTLFLKKYLLKAANLIYKNKPAMFAICYLVMVTIYSLFFNIKCYDAQTSLNSMQRYLFCNCFFLVFIMYVPDLFSLTLRNFFVFNLILMVGFILIGLNGDALSFLQDKPNGLTASFAFFFVLFLYMNLFFLSVNSNRFDSLYIVLFVVNTAFCVYYYNGFINNLYVG